MTENTDSDTELAIVKSQLSHMDKVFDKLTETLDRIADLCNNSSSLINLHEQKFKENDKHLSRLHNNYTELNKTTKSDIKDLHSRITTQHKEVEDQMSKEIDKVFLAIRDLKEDLGDNQKNLAKRVTTLESWRWIIVGILIAAGIILPELRTILAAYF